MKSWRLISSAFLVVFISFSCQKDSPDSAQSESKDHNGTNTTPQFSLNNNVNNPFNYLGQAHTYALSYLANQNHFPKSSKAQIYNSTKSYLSIALNTSHFLTKGKSNSNYSNQIKQLASSKKAYANLNHGAFFNHFISKTNLSSRANNYLNNFKNAYNKFKNYNNLKAQLLSIENNIVNDQRLSNQNQKLLLGMAAIARKDANHWYNVLGNENHPWYNAYTKNLSESQQIDLMVNLSGGSAMVYGLTYLNETNNQINHVKSAGAATLQASFSVGPVIIEDGDMD